MPQSRMNREEFFAKLAPLDAEQRGPEPGSAVPS
jgi:hypothetical protein